MYSVSNKYTGYWIEKYDWCNKYFDRNLWSNKYAGSNIYILFATISLVLNSIIFLKSIKRLKGTIGLTSILIVILPLHYKICWEDI